jgi:hypothetical protein
METVLTDQEKTEAWIDLAIYYGWIDKRMPEEVFETLDLQYNESGSTILRNQFAVDNRLVILDSIKRADDSKLALLTLELINGSFYFLEEKLRSLYFFWYAVIQEYKVRHNFEIPERLIPKFYLNDVHNVLHEVKQEYNELTR